MQVLRGRRPSTISPIAWFMTRVKKTDSGCWLWTGYCKNGRYGHLQLRGRSLQAHVHSYELHCGPVPTGLEVCHRCDVSRCVNPAHLFLATHRENMLDCASKDRLGGTKLTRDARKVLCAEYASGGVTQAVLAAKYGVSQGVVSHVLMVGGLGRPRRKLERK